MGIGSSLNSLCPCQTGCWDAGHALLESDAICINWPIEDSLSFSSLCYLLPLGSNGLECLCLSGSDRSLQLLDLLSLVLLALHLQSVFSFSHPDLDLSARIQLYLLHILCPRYRYLPDDLTLSTKDSWGNDRVANQGD